MSFTYGFYDSVDGDRKYNSIEMSQIFDGLIIDGVYETIGQCFKVSPSSSSEITIGTGRAWFDHTWNLNDSIMIIDCGTSEILLDRIDAIVLEVDRRLESRSNSIKIIHGTPSSNPVKPTLSNSNDLYQHPLAYIRRHANDDAISAADIENVVGTSECPFVIGVVKTMNIDMFIEQWGAEWNNWLEGEKTDFENWYESLQTILDGDVAANLANQIIEINSKLTMTPFGNNTNLNSITNIGMYYFNGDNVEGLINAPQLYEQEGFNLYVSECKDGIWQMAIGNTSGATAFRLYVIDDDDWYPWWYGLRAFYENGFFGIAAPNGDASWVRTPLQGLIPYQSGGSSSLGTNTWPFSTVYANNFYGIWSGNAIDISKVDNWFVCVRGNGSVNLTAGTQTVIPMNTTAVAHAPSGAYTFSSNGVRIGAAGTYIVFGGAYFGNVNGVAGVYFWKNNTEMASNYVSRNGAGATTSGGYIFTAAAGDVIYLKGRSSVATTITSNNAATFLAIIRLS